MSADKASRERFEKWRADNPEAELVGPVMIDVRAIDYGWEAWQAAERETLERCAQIAEAALREARAALKKIADNYGGCRCDHSTEDCCENPKVGEFCPHCISELALKSSTPAEGQPWN